MIKEPTPEPARDILRDREAIMIAGGKDSVGKSTISALSDNAI